MGKPNYEKLGDAAERPPKVEIPSFDPLVQPKSPSPPAESLTSYEQMIEQPAVATRTTQRTEHARAAERPIFLTAIDPSEKPTSVGHLMYPSRQEQLTDLEYIEGRKRWRIIEQALDEYVARHYGTERGKLRKGSN